MNAVIVIPCYNESRRLPIAEYESFLDQNKDQIVFVNDGSTDGTIQILEGIQHKYPLQVSILNLKKNVGKAEAVRIGILTACRDIESGIVGYMDADLATPFEEVSNIKQAFSITSYRMVFGSRILRIGANIHRFHTRHYLGRVMATLVSIYLNIPIYDSQCGAKFFEPSIAKELFKTPFVSRWLFDVEIFKRIILSGNVIDECCYELPLHTWIEKGGSKISLWDFIKLPVEFMRIFKYYLDTENTLDFKVLYQD